MKAADIMTHRPVTASTDTPIEEAAHLLLTYRISGLPVVDKTGRLAGVVSEGDLSRAGHKNVAAKAVKDVMTSPPVSVEHDTDVGAIVELFEQRKIKRVPVLRSGTLIGIVSRADLLRGLAQLAKIMPGASVEDRSLRDNVVAALSQAAGDASSAINVVVRNGKVELRGAVAHKAAHDELLAIARKVPGVGEVRDALVVVDAMTDRH